MIDRETKAVSGKDVVLRITKRTKTKRSNAKEIISSNFVRFFMHIYLLSQKLKATKENRFQDLFTMEGVIEIPPDIVGSVSIPPEMDTVIERDFQVCV